MYSMFSEMMRLIPPERTVVDWEGADDSTTRYGDGDGSIEEEDHASEQHDTQDNMNMQEEDWKTWDSPASIMSVDPVAGREEDISRQGTVYPAFSLGDLDALLRF